MDQLIEYNRLRKEAFEMQWEKDDNEREIEELQKNIKFLESCIPESWEKVRLLQKEINAMNITIPKDKKGYYIIPEADAD